MKSLVYAVVAASVLSAPLVSFAQSNGPVTRAQVQNELIQLEQAGYNPAAADPYYPNDIQAAQQRVNAQQGNALATADTSGYGGAAAGTAQSGTRIDAPKPMNVDETNALYYGR
ncbi:DUF4148 domain-containing protein [Trinickia fusca]|uniref:DUF4148 domain-containing protein n=1 Tax=Trinickia fusca TaxID=2419777 RepID=A0A494XJ77_9BURK|nr:DUF4148 domain-containing protein [Trinickia fusca]RKP47613.1 DUF4148 domain-containing protein [Trinickia fusca]